jgi:oligopeptidase B
MVQEARRGRRGAADLRRSGRAEGKDYFRLGALIASDDGRFAATMVDDEGSERFKLRIRDLESGSDIETVTEVGIGAPVWAADNRTLIFTEVNENWRSYRARLHVMGQPPESDITVYEETEELGFTVGVSRSQDRSLIFVSTGDNSSTEVRFVPAADPTAELRLVSRRQPNRIYSADAGHGKLWILVNDEHINFRIAEAEIAAPGEWKTLIAGSDEAYLRGVTPFRDHLVIEERLNGLDQVRLRSYSGEERRIRFPEASYTASLGSNPEFAPAAYRLSYSSMVTPTTVYDYHPAEDRLEVLKVQEIPSGYDASKYVTERLMLPARDGKRVPVSVVYPKTFEKNGEGKLYLYAYGAYGYAIPPSFSTARMSLLDRGFACAIAHVRGATISAMAGSWTGRPRSAPTPSTISSMWRRGWWMKASPRPAASPSRAGRRAAS